MNTEQSPKMQELTKSECDNVSGGGLPIVSAGEDLKLIEEPVPHRPHKPKGPKNGT